MTTAGWIVTLTALPAGIVIGFVGEQFRWKRAERTARAAGTETP